MCLCEKKKKLLILIPTIIGIVILYLITYIPHKIISINFTEVSRIEIFDGGHGKGLTVTEKDKIEHIISNLNNVTFYKGNCSIGKMGYRFNMTIYKNDGKEYKKLIINSNDKIRYNGFFYDDKSSSIDYDYLNELLK